MSDPGGVRVVSRNCLQDSGPKRGECPASPDGPTIMTCLGGNETNDKPRGRDCQGFGEAGNRRDDGTVELDALVVENCSTHVRRSGHVGKGM